MYRFARNLLFALPPETSHRVALSALAAAEWSGCTQRFVHGVYQPVRVMGLGFRNRVGLAAGLDKDARCVAGLMALGFGFVEVGTVTPLPQAGNPRPRLFRLREHDALLNRMGFNNAGMDAMARRLEAVRSRLPHAAIVGVNIGKNRDTPLEHAVDDYLKCLQRLHPVADYLTVNVSSPNTPGLRSLQDARALRELLLRLKSREADLAVASGRRVPLVAKVAPDLGEQALLEVAEVLIDCAMDGVIATNTTVARPISMAALPAGTGESGGLSGPPLYPLALRTVGVLAAHLRGRVPIIAAGGIHDLASARAMIDAGAILVQVYTGFIYEGPALVHRLACGLG